MLSPYVYQSAPAYSRPLTYRPPYRPSYSGYSRTTSGNMYPKKRTYYGSGPYRTKKVMRKRKITTKKQECTPMTLVNKAANVASSMLGKWLGMGTYKVEKNSLLSDEISSQVPFMHSSVDGVRIRHREYIGDVKSSVGFVNTVFDVNPGLAETFPWLSSIAQNFEQYRFDGLIFEFKTTSADALNSTNTALGVVVLAAEYNSAAPTYTNKQQMENSMWAVSTKPSQSIICPIECDPKKNTIGNLYTRFEAPQSGEDIRLFDLCNIQVGTVGSQAAAVIGELWVSYDVVLLKPQMPSGLALNSKTAVFNIDVKANPVGPDDYFGNSRKGFDNIGIKFTTNNTINFPIGTEGNWLIYYTVSGSVAVNPTLSFTPYTNSLPLTLFLNKGNAVSSNAGLGSSNISTNMIALTVVDPSQLFSVTLASGAFPTTQTSCTLVIQQINGSDIVDDL